MVVRVRLDRFTVEIHRLVVRSDNSGILSGRSVQRNADPFFARSADTKTLRLFPLSLNFRQVNQCLVAPPDKLGSDRIAMSENLVSHIRLTSLLIGSNSTRCVLTEQSIDAFEQNFGPRLDLPAAKREDLGVEIPWHGDVRDDTGPVMGCREISA